MALNVIAESSKIESAPHRENYGTVLRQTTRNMIRALQDRSIQFAKNEFGEAYIDANGRINSVNTTYTTSIFSTNKYVPKPKTSGAEETKSQADTGGTTGVTLITTLNINQDCIITRVGLRANSGTLTINIKKNGTDTIATKSISPSGSSQDVTFTSLDYTKALESGDTCDIEFTSSGGTVNISTNTFSYSGTLFSYTNQHIAVTNGTITVTGATAALSDMKTLIYHDIPTGTFSSTISSCIGSPLMLLANDVTNVKFKLTNATEDTDWLNCDEVVSFTAFTSEPTKCIVQLDGTTDPSLEIYGFGVVE